MPIIRSPRHICAPTEYFSVALAEKYGLTEAIILSNISRATSGPKSDEIKVVDGLVYAKLSLATLHSWMPYFSEQTIKRAVTRLVDQEVLAKGRFNESKMDHTSWFAVIGL